MSAVTVERLTKSFGRGTLALDIPALSLAKGEMAALIGASGSGKSTLLRHLNALVLGDAGSITVQGRVVQKAGRPGPGIRQTRSQIGFVFQQFNLVERLPVLTNVLAGRLARMPTWRSMPGWFLAAEKRRTRPQVAGPGRHRPPRPSARLHPLRRPAAARRHRPRPHPGRPR